MKVREWRGEVVFQHLVGPGAAERSWGVHVARLAGVPRPVLTRAGQVLAALEERARNSGQDALADELPLFARGGGPAPKRLSPVEDALAGIDPDAMSPREAQEALYTLKSLAGANSALQHEQAVAETSDKLV
jgi:DNA mismatch repair protein MutS